MKGKTEKRNAVKELIPYKVNAEPHNISHLSNSPSFQRFFADKCSIQDNRNISVGSQYERCSSEPNKEIICRCQRKDVNHSESCDSRDCCKREPLHMHSSKNLICMNDNSKSNLPTPTIKLNLCNELNKRQLSTSTNQNDESKDSCIMPQMNKSKATKSCVKLNSYRDQSAVYIPNLYKNRNDLVDCRLITFNNNEDLLKNLSTNLNLPNMLTSSLNNREECEREEYGTNDPKLFYRNEGEFSEHFSEISPITSSEKKKHEKLIVYEGNYPTNIIINNDIYQRQQRIVKHFENFGRKMNQKLITMNEYEPSHNKEQDSFLELNESNIHENKHKCISEWGK